MNRLWQRMFFSASAAHLSTENSSVSSELTSRDIENYYLRVIVDSLRRMLVKDSDMEVGVKREGTNACGLASFGGYVRILKWDPVVMPVLLQNIPVIDARIRQVVGASVLLEHTHFAGLWFQASSGVEGSPQDLLGMPCEIRYQHRAAPSTR